MMLLLLDLPVAGDLADRLHGFLDAPGVAPIAFVVAFATGATHALAPGHGKSLAAAYLIGSNGRIRDAAWLGISVAAMHTISVLVIALAWTFFSLSDLVRLPTLTSGLQLVAGLVVIGTGIWLLVRQIRRGRHGHTHTHDHTHKHSHDHAPGRPGLVLLGLSGGLVPSPAAFFVLVTGLFLGRAGFALLLVASFGIGMATVLFGVGLLALAGTNAVTRAGRSHAALQIVSRIAPMAAAASVTVLGGVITVLAAQSLVYA